LKARYDAVLAKHPKLDRGNRANHLGTLGTGNHFIEVCLDESDTVWFMLHSESRCAQTMPESPSRTGEASGLSCFAGDHGSPATEEVVMKVEILYFSGCPNYDPAVARLSDILRQEAVCAELVEVEIKDAHTAHMMGFLGSPSIRINGRDVEPTARSSRAFGLTCRTYVDDGNRAGVPPSEVIRAAVREAKEN
jgi:tRNA-splicing ligase RtcB